MIELDLEVNENITAQLNYIATAQTLPNTKQAFDSSIKAIQAQWRGWTTGGEIKGISNIKKPDTMLARSVEIQNVGDFHSIIQSTSSKMEKIEKGSPAYDMKKTYPFGKKSRVSKKGKGYLIVPFRWGTPNNKGGERAHFKNVIPDYLYEAVKKLKGSQETGGKHVEPNYSGENIERAEYNWGERVSEDLLQNANSNMLGLVRMENVQQRPYSTYFTFRVISEISPANSWIRKEIPGVPVTETLVKNNKDNAEKLLAEGLKKDLLSLQ